MSPEWAAWADDVAVRELDLHDRSRHVATLRTPAEGMVADAEVDRFLGCAQALAHLGPGDLDGLTLTAAPARIAIAVPRGIFDAHTDREDP